MKLGYQQGDHLAYWWIDQYVDVADNQEELTKEAIARFFAWHRKDQLPEIAGLLRRAKTEVQLPVNSQQVEQIQDDVQRLARAAYDKTLPDVADLLLTLTPDQIDRMRDKFKDGNEKYAKKFMRGTTDKQVDARYDKVMDYAKLIYGRFSSEQEAAIRKAVQPVVLEQEARYQERIKRQQAWLALAQKVQTQHPSKDQVMAMLRQFGDQWQKPPGRERAANYEAANDAGVALTVAVANMTTPEQKKHAAERFQGWIDDAQSLMREQPTRVRASATPE
jgi:hypothetical protein